MGSISNSIEKKAAALLREGRVKKDVETDRRIHFLVHGETDDHIVVYDKVKEEWSCDCKFSSLREKECSHVYASKLLLKK